MTTVVPVVVCIEDDYLDTVMDVVETMTTAGFTAEQVLADLGTVTGTVRAGDLEALAAVPGVASVETERTPHVPPPDSDLQ